MMVLLTLLGLGVVTWAFRITFTALVPAERLPAGVRSRMDAVGTAAFAALLATEVSGTSPIALPATAAAVVAAAIAARFTGSHLAAVAAAAAAWALVSMW